ncbi:MAG: aryl-sulfate sulfotransferase, partial [Verrucomicrobia bacterium]|nr:aryl-sulfate sulfotransferase [Verrucomicrobiota bacterium]
SYLTFSIRNTWGWDWSHANAIIEDPRDDSLIISLRHQNAVIKFARATGQLKWILGPPENWGPAWQQYLLTPVGAPFQWNYGQHAPMITSHGTLLIYDNGNCRSSPFAESLADSVNYSRAAEFSIDEQAMEVSQLWEYGSNVAQPLYTDQVGNADWLPRTGNVLIHFGCIQYKSGVHPSAYSPSATMVRIKEVTHDQPPEVVMDISIFDYYNTSSTYHGYYAYRSHRVPDLYGHPARAVADLTVNYAGGAPHLQFSGDPVRTYVIETSDDLEHWIEIATAEPGEGGNYEFTDSESGDTPNRYYRVETR